MAASESGRLGWRIKMCYGVGHILNDFTASMWFTYLLVYLHKVIKFSSIDAGILLLIGQVADALSTPLVGIESDRTEGCSYGRRKIWHLVGVVSVVISFPFIFNLCIGCGNASRWALFFYYSPFIVVFQFGWAATQIAHLSMIPELANSENEKCSLNALRIEEEFRWDRTEVQSNCSFVIGSFSIEYSDNYDVTLDKAVDSYRPYYKMAVVEQSEISWRVRISYGFGHVLNDLCASTWFTYLLIYMKNVVKFSSVQAGTLLLLGQLFDAIVTPVVAMEMDNTRNWKYGSKKHWHLAGSLVLACSFPFVFNLCIGCGNADRWAMFFYYVPFIFLLQVGWGCVQIAHLSLIPELADRAHDKCELNAGRYAATVASNIFVFIITWVMLDSSAKKNSDPNQLNKSDAKAFMHVVFVVVCVGLFFVTLFHLGVKEKPRNTSHQFANKSSRRSASNWAMWFKVPLFYQTAIMYMCVRLIVNITQVYIPMYTMETLHLTKDKIAIMPLIVYVSGFVSTFLTKPLNKYIGRQGVFLSGLIIIFVACTWLWLLPPRNPQIYGASVLIGVGGSTLLVTALTMLADLIGENVETGAFVYGAMSFMDKISNGIVVQIIQACYPDNADRNSSVGGDFYRKVMVFVAGSAAVLALITLLTTIKRKRPEHLVPLSKTINDDDERRRLLSSSLSLSTCSVAVSHEFSWSLVYIKGPLTPYEPLTMSVDPDHVQMTGQAP